MEYQDEAEEAHREWGDQVAVQRERADEAMILISPFLAIAGASQDQDQEQEEAAERAPAKRRSRRSAACGKALGRRRRSGGSWPRRRPFAHPSCDDVECPGHCVNWA
mmetsp:Transcript_16701/g.43147  ORF Transcript_16701/g.43147 Transcript_16701/m.43147 type:complete len:107 (+) Transcript_16701:37-357(+)